LRRRFVNWTQTHQFSNPSRYYWYEHFPVDFKQCTFNEIKTKSNDYPFTTAKSRSRMFVRCSILQALHGSLVRTPTR